MATSFSMLQIMNAALVAEGFDEALAENDGTVEWRLLSRNWPLIVEAELEDGNYHFTRKQAELLTRADGLRALVTSREVLNLRAEHVFPVHSELRRK